VMFQNPAVGGQTNKVASSPVPLLLYLMLY
jgi:hypothetical protein